MSVLVTFEQGNDPDIAQVQVQNKLQLATPLLPEEVQRQGVRVAKYQINFMQVVALVDESRRMTQADLADYIATNLQDPTSRTSGVGDFMLFGSQYEMRIWQIGRGHVGTPVNNAQLVCGLPIEKKQQTK